MTLKIKEDKLKYPAGGGFLKSKAILNRKYK